MNMSIPALHVSDVTTIRGDGTVFIANRAGGGASGNFTLTITAPISFTPPAPDYPAGSFRLQVDLNDSLKGTYNSTTVDLINSHGGVNPTAFFTGRCKVEAATHSTGLRYWILVANNGTPTAGAQMPPDVVSFGIHDSNGKMVAYGTGPLRSGDLKVTPAKPFVP